MITDPRIDAYIAAAAPFAQPILTHLRALVHAALPEGEEAIKWGMPHFMVGGKNVAGMSAFKAHAAFIIHGDGRQGDEKQGDAMGQYGKIASLADLPSDADLTAKLHAIRDNLANGVKKPRVTTPKAAIAMPDDFAAALALAVAASAHYNAFTPAQQREYLEWIVTAKAADTRTRRIAQAIEWIAEGKKRNWKYEKC
jgi:uncharacterized protein YdeI (YjbR/CyaY-like superfamily)